MPTIPAQSDERVLILAPVARDGPAMQALLNERGLSARFFSGSQECARCMAEGAGALVLTEEALELPGVPELFEVLKGQPPWSELPLIILTSGGESRAARLLDLAASAAGSVTLLERPMRAVTLWHSIEVALRSRRRQYEVRNLLELKGKLAAIVEFSEDAIIGMHLNGVITSWNRGAEYLFGYTAREAVGQSIKMLIPPERLNEEPDILERVRRGEPVEHYETVRRRKDGTLLDISLTVSPVLDERGQIVGASKVARDIGDRKRAEERLRESEERYRTLVSQVKDYAIFWADTGGRATTWNEGVKRVLGFGKQEFIGEEISATIFTPEDIQAGVPQRELQTAAAEGSANNDRWMRRKDGTRFFASGITTALKDESGTVVGFCKVLRDVTDKKQAEEILEHTVAERTADLRAANEQLEAFVYSIAHDLRAPLRSMTGYSQLLVEDYSRELDDPALQMLRRIQASSEFMDKLLVDLLAYGRTARAQLELQAVQVQKAWESALLQCAVQIEQSGAEIQTIEPLPLVHAHETTLGQVLANLLSNALKFVAPGVQPRIRFRAQEQATFVRLWMEDNGIGIPPEQHERVFRVFERLDGGRYAGTGIGLSIVRKGVERMDGQVGLESEPGKGSRFWIELAKTT